jgi:protein-L-isoaspartate(D-aspartate) O-methyltransferase
MKESDFTRMRQEMVQEQLVKRGISDKRILDAFLSVPRHQFVPEDKRHLSYDDSPVPIGDGQTISQPYMVALMTDALGVQEGEKVLEVGLGSGYQAAILAQMSARVYAVERIPSLLETASMVIGGLGYKVEMSLGDGTLGWREHAPYDRIIVSAAAPSVSVCLLGQLANQGRLIMPLGGPLQQDLTVVEKDKEGNISQRSVCGCLFVPLIGKYGCQF